MKEAHLCFYGFWGPIACGPLRFLGSAGLVVMPLIGIISDLLGKSSLLNLWGLERLFFNHQCDDQNPESPTASCKPD